MWRWGEEARGSSVQGRGNNGRTVSDSTVVLLRAGTMMRVLAAMLKLELELLLLLLLVMVLMLLLLLLLLLKVCMLTAVGVVVFGVLIVHCSIMSLKRAMFKELLPLLLLLLLLGMVLWKLMGILMGMLLLGHEAGGGRHGKARLGRGHGACCLVQVREVAAVRERRGARFKGESMANG